jgi:hypothetical protein
MTDPERPPTPEVLDGGHILEISIISTVEDQIYTEIIVLKGEVKYKVCIPGFPNIEETTPIDVRILDDWLRTRIEKNTDKPTECLHGIDMDKDRVGVADYLADCLNCEVENCPVKDLLMKWRAQPL